MSNLSPYQISPRTKPNHASSEHFHPATRCQDLLPLGSSSRLLRFTIVLHPAAYPSIRCLSSSLNRHPSFPPRLDRYPRPKKAMDSSSSSCPTKPPGWTPDMSMFVEKLLCNGEEVKSVTILLETEWPSMEGKVQVAWVEALRK